RSSAAKAMQGWFLVLLAPVIGRFLGVLIRRLPDGRAIVWARSWCGAWQAVLTARDLVPLVSWLALPGRCRRWGRAVGRFCPGRCVDATDWVGATQSCSVRPGRGSG